MFIPYPKIHRIGKEETDGILLGTCYIEEKIDGANTSIWFENGELKTASRTQIKTDGFNGFVDCVKNNEPIKKCLSENPNYRLYGEWLVRHTIAYNELAYKKFYLFDITIISGTETEQWLTREEVLEIGAKYGIPTPKQFGRFIDPTEEEIRVYAGKTDLGDKGEGIVIKNPDFINKFGVMTYAKIVTESFKEDNSVTFGGNNKHSDTYNEVYVVNKYISLARVEKIMNKIQPTIDKRLDLEHIPRITGTVYHDMLTEEIWEIQDKIPSLNFQILKRIAYKKIVQIYKEILTGDISVAHNI